MLYPECTICQNKGTPALNWHDASCQGNKQTGMYVCLNPIVVLLAVQNRLLQCWVIWGWACLTIQRGHTWWSWHRTHSSQRKSKMATGYGCMTIWISTKLLDMKEKVHYFVYYRLQLKLPPPIDKHSSMLNVTARLAVKVQNLPDWEVDWDDITPQCSRSSLTCDNFCLASMMPQHWRNRPCNTQWNSWPRSLTVGAI